MSNLVPSVGRPNCLSACDVINGFVPGDSSEPTPSPRTSSTSSTDDRNAILNASIVLSNNDEGSESSEDAPDNFHESIEREFVDLCVKISRNFKLLPKAKLVDKSVYYGPVANKALKRYNCSDLTTVKDIMTVKQDLKTVDTIIDRKGTKAIVAATALRKIVVKLESALITMSPEHQGLILEDNITSSKEIEDLRRDVEKQLQKFNTKKINSKSRVNTDAVLNRTLNFVTENEHTIGQFLIELNGTDIEHSVLSEVPSLIAACKELVHLCDEFDVPDSEIQVIYRLYTRFSDIEKSMKEIQTLMSQNRKGPSVDRDDFILELANRTLAYLRTWKISVRDMHAVSGLDTPKLDIQYDIRTLTY